MSNKGIEGIITASGWDDDGSVLSISIRTNLEEEISIHMDEQGRLLANNCNQFIRVKGALIQVEDDWREKLQVYSFEILKRTDPRRSL